MSAAAQKGHTHEQALEQQRKTRSSRRGRRSAAAELERAEKKSRLSAAAEKGLTYKQAVEQEQIAQAQCNNSTAETGSSGVDALVPLVDAVDAGDTLEPLVEDALVEPALNTQCD